MKTHLSIILSFVLFFISCDFGNGKEEIHIIGKYYVGWVDLESNRSIYFKKTPDSNSGQVIVSGYVFEIGNNDRYIIAKTINEPNSTQEYYHIIDTRGYFHTNMDNNNYWMFSSDIDFKEKLESLGVSMLNFDRNFDKNPWK